MSDVIDAQLESALKNLKHRWMRYNGAQASSLLVLSKTIIGHEATHDRAFDLQEEFITLRATMSKAETLAKRAHYEWANLKADAVDVVATPAPFLSISQVNVAAPGLNIAAPQINLEVTDTIDKLRPLPLPTKPKLEKIGVKLVDNSCLS